jgi:hypothetical protein
LAVFVSGIAVTTNGAPRPGWSAEETSVQNFGAQAVSATGQSLDPTAIPKYVIPLVIPPVMDNDGEPDSYDIAVREFKQQILPGGIWNLLNGRNDKYKPTTVWSYGPAADSSPNVAPDPNSQFNYPAYTIETISDLPVDVKWINDLVDKNGKYLPHLIPIDQTLHWANPPAGPGNTDSVGTDPESYEGPVPIVTHVHGAHVDPHSDGYPEAWWLPAANNIPGSYATSGTLFDDKTGGPAGGHAVVPRPRPGDDPQQRLCRTGGLLDHPGRRLRWSHGLRNWRRSRAPGPGAGRRTGCARAERARRSGPQQHPRDSDRHPGSLIQEERQPVLPADAGRL